LDVKGCSVVELTSDDGRVDPVDDLIRRTEIVVETAGPVSSAFVA
jgi:hypothetical protein